MPLEHKDVIVGDKEYSIPMFTTSKGLLYLKQLTKVIVPSFVALSEGAEQSVDLQDPNNATLQSDNLLKAANLLVENMDKEDIVELIKNLVKGVRVDNKELNFEMDFAGNYGELLSVLTQVIKYNFSSVFPNGGFGFPAATLT